MLQLLPFIMSWAVAAAEEKRRMLDVLSKPKQKPLPSEELQSVYMSKDNRCLVEGILRDNSISTRSKGGEVMKSSNIIDTNHEEFVTQPHHPAYRLHTSESFKLVSLEESGYFEGETETRRNSFKQKLIVETNSSDNVSNLKNQGRAEMHNVNLQSQVDVQTKLLRMGFTDHYVSLALVVARDITEALDWLIMNVPEKDLPSKFAPDSSKASVRVLVGDKKAEASYDYELDDHIHYLLGYGYSYDDCVEALLEVAGDQESALYWLFQHSLSGWQISTKIQEPCEMTDSLVEEMRADEIVALRSIFGDSIYVVDSVFKYGIPVGKMRELYIEMEIRLPSRCRYPFEIPIIVFRGNLPSQFLLEITKKVAAHAVMLLGAPMIYELIGFSTNLLELASINDKTVAAARKSNSVTTSVVERSTQIPDKLSHYTELASMHVSRDIGILSDEQIALSMCTEPFKTSETQSERIEEHSNGCVDNIVADRQFVKLKGSSESERLHREWDQLQNASTHEEMRAARSKLPVFTKRTDLLAAVDANPLVIVCGETGCGKSTQVPQYILEQWTEKCKGGFCNIICTQPRRLSAIGLADRVARERGQEAGKTVGFSVRLESCYSQHTRILFCTTGILLRRMLSNPDLQGVTHIVIDEVHERTLEIDLLLLLLRKQLNGGAAKLRVILMSATVNAADFVSYFREDLNCEPVVVFVPGFTFPVTEFFLEDVLDHTSYKIGRNSKYAMKSKQAPKAVSNSDASKTLSLENVHNWESRLLCAEQEHVSTPELYSQTTISSLSVVDESKINYELIEILICSIFRMEDDVAAAYEPQRACSEFTISTLAGQVFKLACDQRRGSMLIFLPGMVEIKTLQTRLLESREIAACSRQGFWVFALHGSLSGQEQRNVFKKPPLGVKKIILATNIAETSITIDDVLYVIDTGRHKEMKYDPNNGLSSLQEAWISKASAKQRRGRAGRVQSGCCIRLFSRQQFQKCEEQQLPEIQRVSLESLCLQVKCFFSGKVDEALSRMLSPPNSQAIITSLKGLQDLSALDPLEQLTPLGEHLARMPVDAHVGKMLIISCMLRCVDPVLTIASAVSGKSPFLTPFQRQDEASSAKQRFSGPGKSDHLAVVAAYNGWVSVRQEGWNAEKNYCTVNFLSLDALLGIEASRLQYFKILIDLGFVSYDFTSKESALQFNANTDLAPKDCNLNSNNSRIVKAVICAGFYPNIISVKHPEKTFIHTGSGTIPKIAAARNVHFLTKLDGRVFLHPTSVNFHTGVFESPWLVFTEKLKTSKVFVRESTMVPAYSLLLFGGEVKVKHETQSVLLDDWLEFEAPARISLLIKELRLKVNLLLLDKIQNPSLDISTSNVVTALIRLLSTDGF
ncbi:hypothetical protein O6H91_04G075900 [Diphasiastrum complanatum]|uniref:Uncharacterized protein n=1 Tax=Diphasiastrum complanatum TaxID=34168 RepID=A0ACC2DYF7_DIPCM|nr:hypothetical protein O6H91_04G075900 [Diphasiastrum complanatum]